MSIIVTAYNVEAYLSTTLLTLLEQTYPNIEIIVVNDASTDGTAALLERISAAHPCIRVITNSENIGAALSKQAGIRAASGQHFILCDGDDFLEPAAIAECIKAAELSGADCVVFGFDHINADSGSLFGATLPIDRSRLPYTISKADFDPDRMSRLSHISPICLLETRVHRDAFAGALLKIPYWEDIPTYIAMLSHAQIVTFVNEPYYHYRVGHQGQSVSNWARARRGMKAVSLLTAVDYLLAQPWSKSRFTRSLIVHKLGRIAIDEFTVMRAADNDHEYELAILLHKRVMQRLNAADIFLARRWRLLIFLAAVRWAPVWFIRRLFGKGRR